MARPKALEDDEIVTAVSFNAPAKGAYAKFPNPASRYAMAGVFVAEGDVVVERALRAGYQLHSILVDGQRTKALPRDRKSVV